MARPRFDGNCYPAATHAVDDVDGILRYRKNRIIDDLVMAACNGQKGPCLNRIALDVQLGKYTEAERAELYRLIGYSLSGFDDVFPDEEGD